MPSFPRAGRVVVIDALAARFGGTAYAGVQIAEALSRRSDIDEVVVVTRPNSIVEHGLRHTAKVRRVVVRSTFGRLELIQRLAWEAVRLPRIVRRHDADGLLILAGMLPRDPGCPFVALQANPTPYEDPDGIGASVRRWATGYTARRARATFVPSNHVGLHLRTLPRVRTVPLGVDRHRFRSRTGMRDQILCVADFYPHKHHLLLLEMHRRLPEPRPVLRLIGNPAVDQRCYDAVCSAAVGRHDVIIAGKVPFSELLEAYARARVFVIASDRESFCMPLAEALVAGVPAVVRDYPTLRETAGPGAVYVNSDDPHMWASTVARLLNDDSKLRALRRAGAVHARRFSWDGFAEQFLAEVGRHQL